MAVQFNKNEHMVLCFGKALNSDIIPFLKGKEKHSLWAALGYFDTLEIYNLQERCGEKPGWIEQTYLDDIRVSREVNENAYYHSFHILSDLTNTAKADRYNDFFKNESPFFFVTLLQGRMDSSDIFAPDLEMKVDDYIKLSINELVSIGELVSSVADSLRWVIYETLDLSNLVVLWKSSSLNAVLKIVDRLHSSCLVGDLHSIPCIRVDIIEKWGKEDLSTQINEEKINQLTIGYLVGNMEKALMFFSGMPNLIDENPKMITGIEDFKSVEEDVDIDGLIRTLNYRLFGKGAQYFREAFIESEIHLGIDHSGSVSSTPRQSRLVKCCKNLQTQYRFARNIWDRFLKEDGIDDDWLMVASKLYNGLSNMSQNAVEDGFCFLVLDSVSMFCKKVKMPTEKVDSRYLNNIHKFLRSWASLMEQAPKIDGRFLQHPGVSPVIYHIPALLLEIYLAFTSMCGQAMQSGSSDNAHFALLLVPKLCRRMKVDVVFHENPPCDRLLNVEIPIHLLYEPFSVLCQLCHEISHFCGDSWRLREQRVEYFSHVISFELAYELNLIHEGTIKLIFDDLYNNMPAGELNYLIDLYTTCMETIRKILTDEDIVTRWIDVAFCRDSPLHKYANQVSVIARARELKTAFESSLSESPQGNFFEIMQDYYYLFNECYADVSVIHVLNLSLEEYISLFTHELLVNRAIFDDADDYYRVVERCALVLNTIYGIYGSNSCAKFEDIKAGNVFPQKLHKFLDDIWECSTFLFNRTALTDEQMQNLSGYFNSRDSIKYVREYLGKCYNKMKESERHNKLQKDELDKFRIIFDNVARKQFLLERICFRMLADYRESIINSVISE